MGYSTILASIDGGRGDDSVLATARAVTRDHDAKLIGLYVAPPAVLESVSRVHLPPDIADAFAKRRLADIKAAEATFDGATRDLPRRAWEVIEVDSLAAVETTIHRRARCADLTVVAQVGLGEQVADRPGTLPDRLVLESGRPMLVVPPALSFPTVGRRVLVAWNQSREAARALADAMPMLRRAEQVWVLTIDEHSGSRPGPDLRVAQAVAYLAEHGVAAKGLHDATGQISASDILLSRVSDLTADLLVLGAYGHSRRRELVMGGVTRDLLSHMTVPVLMSH